MIAGLLAFWSIACLPHDSLGRAAEAPALAWRIRTEGREHTLTRQFARAFRDGSQGWLYCLDNSSTCAELRAFPEGEILSLAGLDLFSEADRADLLAAWPLLSPRLEPEPDLLSSWPLGHAGRVVERVAARGGWRREGAQYRWRAKLGRAGAYEAGEIDATLTVDGTGSRSGTWTMRFERCESPDNCRVLSRSGELERLEERRPRRTFAPCPEGPDPARAPLCLADGTRIADDPNATRGLSLGNSDTMPTER